MIVAEVPLRPEAPVEEVILVAAELLLGSDDVCEERMRRRAARTRHAVQAARVDVGAIDTRAVRQRPVDHAGDLCVQRVAGAEGRAFEQVARQRLAGSIGNVERGAVEEAWREAGRREASAEAAVEAVAAEGDHLPVAADAEARLLFVRVAHSALEAERVAE